MHFQLSLSNSPFIVLFLLCIQQVLVNFSASWCGPCGNVLPLFCSLAKKYTSMMFLVVDVDELYVSVALNSSFTCNGIIPLVAYMHIKFSYQYNVWKSYYILCCITGI